MAGTLAPRALNFGMFGRFARGSIAWVRRCCVRILAKLLFLDDLDIGLDAGAMEVQQRRRQLPQIVSGRARRKLAGALQHIRDLD
jgi:hypothetical protein